MGEYENLRNANAQSIATDPFVAACQLTSFIRAHADETERGRRLAAPVVERLRATGLFAMGLAASLGGTETPVPTVLRVIEEIAYADGATGWNLMVAFESGVWAGFVRGVDARALISSIPLPIIAGSISPPGRMYRMPGGYRLTGRWRFGSGCQHANLFIASTVLCDREGTFAGANEMSDMFQVVLRACDVKIIDTWHVAGLRGTGSHDFAVENLFVEEGLVQPLNFDVPVESGPLYAFPLLTNFSITKAAVAIGVARHAVEALRSLALTKTPTAHTSLLRERPAVQGDLARAEALVRSARAFLHETVDEAWRSVAAGNALTVEQRAWLKLAAVDGVQRAVQAVDLMYNAGGATAIYESNPLERCFRDVHVVPAHVNVQPAAYEIVGRVFLNLPPGNPFF